MPLLLLLLLPFPPSASAEYLGELSANPYDSDSVSTPYGYYGILIHQSRSIICMAQAGASKGDSSPVWS